MSNENLKGKPSQAYTEIQEAVRSRPVEIPQARKFVLSEPGGEHDFFDALRASSSWISTDNTNMLLEAVRRKFFIDTYKEHLADVYKIDRPKGQSQEEFIEQKNVWEDSVVIERSWIHDERRFVRMAPKDEFRRVKHSRLAFIVPEMTIRKAEDITLAVGGAGVGSAVTYLWALTCGENIRIADGGVLNEHNFNRFLFSETGRMGDNLAVTLTEKLLEADPYLNVTCIPQNLGVQNKEGIYPIENFLKGKNVIGLEEVDNPAVKGDFRQVAQNGILNEETGELVRVPVLMVSDLQKGGKVTFATQNDPILVRLTPEIRKQLVTPDAMNFADMTDIIIKIFIGKDTQGALLEPLQKARDTDLGYWPQSGISAFLMAAAGVNTILDYLEGKTIPTERDVVLWHHR